MPRLLIAALLAILAATPALAQHRGGGRGAHTSEPVKPKVDEAKYKSAVNSIPDQQGTQDPWAGVRVTPSGSSTASTTKKSDR